MPLKVPPNPRMQISFMYEGNIARKDNLIRLFMYSRLFLNKTLIIIKEFAIFLYYESVLTSVQYIILGMILFHRERTDYSSS